MKHSSLALPLLIVFVSLATAAPAESALRPWEKNPWYWSYRDKPVLLLGGSDDDNLSQWFLLARSV